jgi:hypothetical protein
MIQSPKWLLVAYAFNILVLIPTCYNMLVGSGVVQVFENHVVESRGLRLMVGSLWLAILVASVLGLVWPSFFAPVLPIQVFYKSVWLLTFVLPLVRARQPFPVGISVVFLIIVVSYPLLFWASSRT